MTIILFLVDTSASMCQKAYVNGVQKSYLDVAKGAVETFLKYRQRSQDCLGDRYMLLTFEDPPSNVKAGWKENHATFMNELKNLQCHGLTSMSEALKNALDLLNLNRMQSGIDTYGQGRCPFYLESSVIIVITDGGKYSFRNGVQQEIILPLNAQIPGTKFTKEPFRWDQRLFSLVLRMSGNKMDERIEGKVPHDDSHIERMCEVTGGRSYRIKSHYVLNQCIESLVQKVQPGVVLHFEQLISKDLKDGEVQDIAFQAMKKMIYVQKHPTQKTFPVGYWPLPESYWPDPKAVSLPARDAHPKIRVITPGVEEPQIVRNFPVDKYEVEASHLTMQILSKREPNKCWPVVIANGIHSFEAPFGYLKVNQTFTQVYLFVLAYNYSVLLPLLHDLIHKFVLNPPNDWMYKFNSYVRSIPQYYCPFLRRALVPISVPYPLLQFMLPENMDNFLSPNVANYLKQIKNTAKQDQESLCLRVYKQLKQIKPPYHQVETAKLNCGQLFRRDLIRNPMLKETFSKLHNDITTFDNYTIIVPSLIRQSSAKHYRNPFDIPRRDLIEEIDRMRDNFLRASFTGLNVVTKDAGHCLPIAEMGNYQEYLKNKETPLREIEPTNVRQHMFGNPYKKDKHMVMVDEADLGDVAPTKPNTTNTPKKLESTSRLRKRKAGPIRRDYIFRRTLSNSQSSHSLFSSSLSSDFEDDNKSDVSSVTTDEEDSERLIASFDFNEPDDFPINGHITNFINGNLDEAEETQELRTISQSQLASSQPQITPIQNNITSHNNTNHPTNTVIFSPLIKTEEVNILHNPSNNTSGNGLTHPFNLHNDINDAQEISKILQQCHIELCESRYDDNLQDNETSSQNNEEIISENEVKEEFTEAEVDNIIKHNLETRSIIFKDIRRPGKDYTGLFDHLTLVKGNFDTKLNFIQMCINESLRFRRKKMASCIQEWWDKQIGTSLTTTNTS